MTQKNKMPSSWKWGLAFFICLFGLVTWAQVTYMPSKIVLILVTALVWFFLYIWSFLKTNRWLWTKIEQKLVIQGQLPTDHFIFIVIKFLIALSLLLLLQIPFLFIFLQILIFIKSVGR